MNRRYIREGYTYGIRYCKRCIIDRQFSFREQKPFLLPPLFSRDPVGIVFGESSQVGYQG